MSLTHLLCRGRKKCNEKKQAVITISERNPRGSRLRQIGAVQLIVGHLERQKVLLLTAPDQLFVEKLERNFLGGGNSFQIIVFGGNTSGSVRLLNHLDPDGSITRLDLFRHPLEDNSTDGMVTEADG